MSDGSGEPAASRDGAGGSASEETARGRPASAALIAWPIWAWLDAERRFEHRRLAAQVPALIAIESYPEKRSQLPPAEREAQLALLGRVVEL